LVWRSAYAMIIDREVELSEAFSESVPDTSIVLHLADLAALSEWRLWKRLLDSESLPNPVVTTFPATPGSAIRKELPLLMPPGDASSVIFVDPSAISVPANRLRAMVVSEGKAKVSMTGPPTEDAWELFVEIAKSARIG